MPARSQRRAFTLIELVVVIVVLAILAGVATIAYRHVVATSQDKSTTLTATALAREAQALAAFRAASSFRIEDFTDSAADLTGATRA